MQPDGDIRPGDDAAEARRLGEIAGAVLHDNQDFFRSQARLAGAELKDKARSYGKASTLLAIAGLFGFLSLALLTATIIIALTIVLPAWLSTLVIGVLYGFIAGGAFLFGRLALDKLDPLPQQSLRLLRETLERIAARSR